MTNKINPRKPDYNSYKPIVLRSGEDVAIAVYVMEIMSFMK